MDDAVKFVPKPLQCPGALAMLVEPLAPAQQTMQLLGAANAPEAMTAGSH